MLILLGVFFVSFASAVIPDDCESSMIAYWQFENNVLDSYGSHDGGAWTGTALYNEVIKVGQAASFSGSQKITIPNAADLDFNSAFTIEFWMIDVDSSSASLFEKGDYKIEFVSGGKIVASAGEVQVNATGIGSYIPYHISVVWDAAGQKLTLYVNGTSVSEAVLSSAANAAGDLIIGDGFKGLIDELAIYDDDLSESVIGLHYSLGSAGKDYCDMSGAAGGSLTEALFNIRGCNFDIGSGTFGVAKGTCSGLPYEGLFYCSDDQEKLYTTGNDDWEGSLGCARGNDEFVMNTGMDFCCPSGMFCNETDSGQFKCEWRTENCSIQKNKGDCEDNGCIWLDIEEICVDRMRDYACGYYNDSESCANDEWNLGTIGIGTELCGKTITCDDGTTYAIPESDCVCAWYDDAPEGKNCQVKLVGVQMFYDTGSTPKEFWCSNAYELGPCEDGEQTVNWTSNNAILSGFTDPKYAGMVPDDCLAALNCVGGDGIRYCGEPIIKLPGFSLFAFFASLFFIGMYYVKRSKI